LRPRPSSMLNSDNRACPDMSQQVWCANDRIDLVGERCVLAHQIYCEGGREAQLRVALIELSRCLDEKSTNQQIQTPLFSGTLFPVI